MKYRVENKVRFTVFVIVVVMALVGVVMSVGSLIDNYTEEAFASVEAVGQVRAFNCTIEHNNYGDVLLDDGDNYYSIEGEGWTDGTPVTVYIADNGTPDTVLDDVVVQVFAH